MGKEKPIFWIGSSKKDLGDMPEDVQDTFGYSLHLAQMGSKHEAAKPLKGFGSAGVLEVVENWSGDTFRRFTRFDSGMRSTCCIVSRRSPTQAARHRRKTWKRFTPA